MKNKILVMLLIVLISLACLYTESYAISSGTRSELKGRPATVTVPTTPSGDNSSSTTPSTETTTTETEPSLSVNVNTELDVSMYEDYEKLDTVNDGAIEGTEHITTNNTWDSDEPGIEGIQTTVNRE